jgi:hypothetical protein
VEDGEPVDGSGRDFFVVGTLPFVNDNERQRTGTNWPSDVAYLT